MAIRERWAQLNQALEHARSSDFYKGRLPPAPLRSMEDLKRVPLMTKEDVRIESPTGLLCVPTREILQYCESSATSGAPISAWFSGRDLAEIRERLALSWGVGFNGDDRVLVRFPYEYSTIGHLVQGAAQQSGACVIAAGASAIEMARVIESMRRLRVTALCVISLGALMIAETAEVMGFDPGRDFPHLRAICCAGEPMSPSRRRVIESAWRVPVYDNYGMTETATQAVDCPQQRLHPWLDLFHIELLDDTLKNDVAPGEVGNVVVTSLTRRAMPMIRYLTGDRARLVDEPCACGRSATLEVRGRKENTLWIHGKPFDAWELEAIVERLPSRRFWKVAPIPDGLRFTVEMDRPSDRIAPELLAGLERDWGIRIEVELVPRGVLYDRTEPISFGLGGKPTYVWSGLPRRGHP